MSDPFIDKMNEFIEYLFDEEAQFVLWISKGKSENITLKLNPETTHQFCEHIMGEYPQIYAVMQKIFWTNQCRLIFHDE